MRTIGDHLRKRRLDLGLTQGQAASRIGVDPFTVLNWEKGRTAPNLRALPAVIRFLGYDPREPGSDLGQRLRAVRRAQGRSLDELARDLRVDPTTLRNWEVGRHRPPVQYHPRIVALVGIEPKNPDLPMGQKLRAYRRAHGLKQRDLGRMLRVTQRTISEWETGRVPVPPWVRNGAEQVVGTP